MQAADNEIAFLNREWGAGMGMGSTWNEKEKESIPGKPSSLLNQLTETQDREAEKRSGFRSHP